MIMIVVTDKLIAHSFTFISAAITANTKPAINNTSGAKISLLETR